MACYLLFSTDSPAEQDRAFPLQSLEALSIRGAFFDVLPANRCALLIRPLNRGTRVFPTTTGGLIRGEVHLVASARYGVSPFAPVPLYISPFLFCSRDARFSNNHRRHYPRRGTFIGFRLLRRVSLIAPVRLFISPFLFFFFSVSSPPIPPCDMF